MLNIKLLLAYFIGVLRVSLENEIVGRYSEAIKNLLKS